MSAVGRMELVLLLLLVVLVLEVLARRVRMPPSAMLVLGGIGLALLPGMPNLELDPDLILLLFLPPLLVSGGYFTAWRDFRADLRIIVQLAVGAVVFTTVVVGVATHLVMPSLPWAVCFTLGAIVSPPDAVAAKAVLKGVKLPRRMVTLLEGESLVNDATGLVLFRVAVVAATTGTFNAWGAVGSFALLAVGGLAVGLAFAYAASFVLARIHDPVLAITGTLLAAWGSFIVGDELGVSGVLSAVATGLVFGWKQHEALPAATRTQAAAVWGTVVFLLESLIFVLIGLSLRGVLQRLGGDNETLRSLLVPVLVVFGAMTAARFAWLLPGTYLPRLLFPRLRRRDPYPPLSVPLVMGWAGMRGVVSLAVALSLPADLPGRDVLLALTFAVILLSILVQGTTLAPLIRLLGLGGSQPDAPSTLREAAARAMVTQAALDAIRAHSRQPDGSERHPRLVEQWTHRVAVSSKLAGAEATYSPHRTEHFTALLVAVGAARHRLLELHRSGQVHDSVLQVLESELDLEELGARQRMGTVPD